MSLADAVERGDVDELIRLADGLADAREWSAVEELRHRCREAVDRGKQLWGVAHWCTYRLAHGAPPDVAAKQLSEPRSPLLPGPVTEILGARHRWADLAPHLPAGPDRSVVAHERALRGDDVPLDDVDPTVVDVPLRPEAWEGPYAPVEYTNEGGSFDPPATPELDAVDLEAGVSLPDEGADALLELARTWLVESAGRAESRCVEGDVTAAIGSFGLRRARIAPIGPGEAMAWMAWLGASGGAYGTRRGGAAGRSAAWWTAAVLTGLDDAWPESHDELGRAMAELSWFAWTDLTPDTGWVVRLAVEDPLDGLAWALLAVDAR